MRIGDTEREEALNALGEHMSAGRLDIDEYGDRSAGVTAARTRRELVTLFADLPEPKPAFGTPTLAVQPGAERSVLAQRSGRRGIPGAVTGPIICVTWVSAIFIGPALSANGTNWLFGVAIAVSIILGSLTRKRGQDDNRELTDVRPDRRRMVRDDMRERRREDRWSDSTPDSG